MQFVFVDYGFAHTTLFPLVRWVHLAFFTSGGSQGCHSFPHDLSLPNFGGQVVFDVMPGTRQVDAYSLRSPGIRGGLGGGTPPTRIEAARSAALDSSIYKYCLLRAI